MTAAECNRRASACAANAALANTEVLSLEFLKLAAQWRAMAVREIFLGVVEVPAPPALSILAPGSA